MTVMSYNRAISKKQAEVKKLFAHLTIFVNKKLINIDEC